MSPPTTRIAALGRLRSQTGSVVIMVALSMTMLLTLAAVSFSTSHAYDRRNQLAAAADAAAKSGAIEVRRNSSVTDAHLVRFGREEARRQGFNMAGSIAVDVHKCTSGGATCTSPYNTAYYVEAIVTDTISTFFGSLLPVTSLTLRARAVAGSSPSPYCIVALAPTSGTPTISIGNAVINMPNCIVAGAGNIVGTNSNARINAENVLVAGTCSGVCSGFTNLRQNDPAPLDPLASLSQPSNPGGCSTTAASSLSAGCYNNISVGGTVTMSPGIDYVTGKINFSTNANLVGASGVMLYLAPGASIVFGNNNTLTLSAPTSGTYAGVSFYQDRSNNTAITFNSNSGLYITGAFYAPSASVSFGNHIGYTGACSQVVVYRLTIANGSGDLDDTSCTAYGGSALRSAAMAE